MKNITLARASVPSILPIAMPVPASSSASMPSALPMLLARYVNGQIAEIAWHNLMHVFDADEITSGERLALAKFVNDLLRERGTRAVNIPALDEIKDLLTETRVH